MRAVRDALPLVTDPELRRRAQVFAAQEGQHGRAHTAHFELLRATGVEIGLPIRKLERRAAWAEANVSIPVRVAITAAAEHVTAVLAREVLTREELLYGIDPRVGRLLRWHALEELEHKSVAFDVMNAIGVSYAVRASSALVAFASIIIRWNLITNYLCQQDGLNGAALRSERLRSIASVDFSISSLTRKCAPYFAPSFHPNQDNDDLLIARIRPEFAAYVVNKFDRQFI